MAEGDAVMLLTDEALDAIRASGVDTMEKLTALLAQAREANALQKEVEALRRFMGAKAAELLKEVPKLESMCADRSRLFERCADLEKDLSKLRLFVQLCCQGKILFDRDSPVLRIRRGPASGPWTWRRLAVLDGQGMPTFTERSLALMLRAVEEAGG